MTSDQPACQLLYERHVWQRQPKEKQLVIIIRLEEAALRIFRRGLSGEGAPRFLAM